MFYVSRKRAAQVAHACSLSLATVRRKRLPESSPPSSTFVEPAAVANGASGDKLFHYMYFHNSRWKTELTHNNTCPLCLVRRNPTPG